MTTPKIKIYKTPNWPHHKNEHSFQLIHRAGIAVFPWHENAENATNRIVFCDGIPMKMIQNGEKVVCGPHVDMKELITFFQRNYNGNYHVVFNALSPWFKNILERHCQGNGNVTFLAIPMPVDIDRFCPALEKKNRFFIYHKNVHSTRLDQIQNAVEKLGLKDRYEYRVFKYWYYRESDFLEYIKEAKFGLWVGCHETQGFAMQESLSCGCPLFVFDVESMVDECYADWEHPWGKLKPEEYPATSASYFDDSCGVICKKKDDPMDRMPEFIANAEKGGVYNPRQFVLDHLTVKTFVERLEKEIVPLFYEPTN